VTAVKRKAAAKKRCTRKADVRADVVINLPKLKTHSAQIFSGAVKKMLFGCKPGLKKATYHKMAPDPGDFGQIICDSHKAAGYVFTLWMGFWQMQGEGPTAARLSGQ
jgi:uncharacterized protein (DUF362 family)